MIRMIKLPSKEYLYQTQMGYNVFIDGPNRNLTVRGRVRHARNHVFFPASSIQYRFSKWGLFETVVLKSPQYYSDCTVFVRYD